MTRLMKEQKGGSRAFATEERIETEEKNHLRRKSELYLNYFELRDCALYPTILFRRIDIHGNVFLFDIMCTPSSREKSFNRDARVARENLHLFFLHPPRSSSA